MTTPGLPSLSNFEDDDDFTPAPTLTPRRRTPAPAQASPPIPETAPAAPVVDDSHELPEAAAEPAATSEVSDLDPVGVPGPGNTEVPRRRRGRPFATPPSSDVDTTRPSNVSIPANLLPLVKARRDQLGFTTGELIIVAIEETADRLGDLLKGRPATGGGLFARRPATKTRQADPQSSLNFRLHPDAFDVLDQLVTQHGAASRSRVVAAALTEYLTEPDDPGGEHAQ